jgi:coenzyme F420-0:L-glutamate ligase/coenzyme F420-1:gamma-L-glutamate ligase
MTDKETAATATTEATEATAATAPAGAAPIPQISLMALPGIPEIKPGDDLVPIILAALDRAAIALQDGDVVVVTQKIVSKAEGCYVDLATVTPSARAQAVAAEADKDPRLVEVILRESRGIVRQRRGTLIMETHHGWICANAGVDRSNVSRPEGGGEVALTLPQDPDASARRIRDGLVAARQADVAVIITDTHGRPWRLGGINLALGVAGMRPIADLRGLPDRAGYRLRVTTVARADELAAAAGLLSGQAAEGLPIVLLRGAGYPRGDGRATDLQRPEERDLFR